ncbi:hypothetical protein K488DRAFT_89782 [Vararia minispora EC-137]|uniref:Uncharacterized protein n=1 Tax=Vararia minispora EC-137 TaxID=1314806 RepID=A0ACB8Q996_9AGAM|nr:hypothetical protein K488DRAFT_89782 [Vararia minispora EC-137]
MTDKTTASSATRPPSFVRLPETATTVTDADEEVFLLYTRLAGLKPIGDATSSLGFRGLGFLDATTDRLPVRLEITPHSGDVHTDPDVPEGKARQNSRRRMKRRRNSEEQRVVLELELWQDTTALRSRAGDTGSVLWRASIDFTIFVLQQVHFPYPSALLDLASLSRAHALELGAGTGLLAAALGPFFRRYTATDMPALVPLLRKNASGAAHALDWTFPAVRQLPDSVLADPPDLLLAIDCLYHPALVGPLLDTLSVLCTPGHTAVLVLSELRADDVVRDFVASWLARVNERWTVVRIADDAPGAPEALGARYAMWVGWRDEV